MGMNPMFKDIILAGAATLAPAASANPEATNATLSPLRSPPTASCTMRHVFRNQQFGSSSPVNN